MAAAKLLNLIAVSTLAILAASFGATPVTAVSVDTTLLGARGHAHAALAKKRRSNNSKRCKPRPSSSSVPVVKPTTTTTKAVSTTTSKAAPAATTTKASSGSGSSNSGGSTNTGGSSGLGKGKASLAWAVNDDDALRNFANAGKIGALYTWSPWYPTITKGQGIRPCPMLWGPKQLSQFKSLVKAGYADCVLGFNEPNQAGQSDLDPAYAAQLWIDNIQPLKALGYTLVSPAPTNAPSGKKWLQDFLKACNGKCTFDAVAVHFYGTDPNAMIEYLVDMHNTFGVNIWPTEFACQNFSGGAQCSMDQVWKFFQTVKQWMEGQSWIDYYFAFGTLYDMGNVNPLNQLLGGDGNPTALGRYYIS